MEQWIETAGISWVHDPTLQTAGSDHLLALVVGRGQGHQRITEIGVAEAAARVLRRELGRPVESPTGGVTEVAVQVTVRLFDTLILVQGPVPALAAVAARLDQLLEDPARHAEEWTPVPSTGHPYSGWGAELGVWLGVGAASLSADLPPDGQLPPGRVFDWLRAMHPDRGTTLVGAATTRSLVGSCFRTAPGALIPPATTLRTRPGPRSMDALGAGKLLSFRIGATAAGSVAARLLVDTLLRAFRLMSGTDRIGSIRYRVADDELIALAALSPERPSPERAAGSTEDPLGANLDALAAYRHLADDVLANGIDEQRTAAAAIPGRQMLVGLAAESVAAGRPLSSADHQAEWWSLSVPAVRDEMAALADSVLLSLPSGTPAPDGYPSVERVRDATPPNPAGAALSGHRRTFPAKLPITTGGRREFVRVKATGSTLRVQSSRSQQFRNGILHEEAFDLTRLVARVDRRSSVSVLIDDTDHRVAIAWSAVRFSQNLRRRLDAATPPDRLLTIADDGGYTETAARQRHVRRWVAIGVTLFLAAVAGVIVLATTAADEPPLVSDMAVGQSATLPNGSQVTVANPHREDVDAGELTVNALVFAVRFCGGGPDDARNYVRQSSFDLTGVSRNALRGWPPEENFVTDTELADGECLDAKLGFEVPDTLPPVGMAVTYHNAAGDHVTWRPVTVTG